MSDPQTSPSNDIPDDFPLDPIAQIAETVVNEASSIAERVKQHAAAMPAAAFVTHPRWEEAKWSATTFQWHPTSEAPPIMGIVFDNAEAGQAIFRDSEPHLNHVDRFEGICISIIEDHAPGNPDPASPGQEHRPGYTVHLYPDPDSLAAHATMDGLVLDPPIVPLLGQWNRHYPIPGHPALLPRFKEEYEKHQEFLLAPAIRRDDGQLWCVSELGIIKNFIEFRGLAEISEDDPDAAALVMPQLVVPSV